VALQKLNASSKEQSSHAGFTCNKKDLNWGGVLQNKKKEWASRSRRPTYANRKVSPSKHNKGGGTSLTKSTLSSKGLTFQSNNKILHLQLRLQKGLRPSINLHSHIRRLLLENTAFYIFDDHADRTVNYFFGRLPQICFEPKA
jgi:hypothetical protein